MFKCTISHTRTINNIVTKINISISKRMDVFLLVVVIILAIILVGVNIYLLIYYSHPDDQGFGESIYPKIVVVLGLTLAFAQILILPLDISNARGDGANFRIDIFWQIVLITVACYIVFLAPFSLFLYEADDEDTCGTKLLHAIKMEAFVIVILIVLFVSTYFFFSKAKIPFRQIRIAENSFKGHSNIISSELPTDTNEVMELDVSFAIYVIAVFSWIGWYVAVLF